MRYDAQKHIDKILKRLIKERSLKTTELSTQQLIDLYYEAKQIRLDETKQLFERR